MPHCAQRMRLKPKTEFGFEFRQLLETSNMKFIIISQKYFASSSDRHDMGDASFTVTASSSTHSDRRVLEVVFRDAVALSNAGASLVTDLSLVETAAIPAFTNALHLLKQLAFGLDESETSNSTARSDVSQLTSEIDIATLEFAEAKVGDANRHLSSSRCVSGKNVELPMSKLNYKCIRSLIEVSQANLAQLFESGVENHLEMRPIRMNDCLYEEDGMSTMQADLVSAIMLYNSALGYLMLSHIRANEPPLVDNIRISAEAKVMLLTSRQLFRLSINILAHYEHILLQHAQQNAWLSSSQSSDMIQTSTLFLFVWVSVLICDHQASLILFLSSTEQPPGAFSHDQCHAQAVFLQQVAETLHSSLDSIYGSDAEEQSRYIEGAAAA